MAWSVTLNGNTYTDTDFEPYGYVTAFPAMMADLAIVADGIEAAAASGGTFIAPVAINCDDAKLTIYDTTTYAANVGGIIDLDFKNSSGTQRTGARLETRGTTGTNAAEVADFVIRTMRAGTLTDAIWVKGDGKFGVGASPTDDFHVTGNFNGGVVSTTENTNAGASAYTLHKVGSNEGYLGMQVHSVAGGGAAHFYTSGMQQLSVYTADAVPLRLGANGNDSRLIISSAGDVSFSSTTAATAYNAASVILAGGLGVAGAIIGNSGVTAVSLSAVSSSTNSTTVTLNNTAASGRNWTIFSSGGGPAAAGVFGVYDSTGGALRFSLDSSGNGVFYGLVQAAATSGLYLGSSSVLRVASTNYVSLFETDGSTGRIQIGNTTVSGVTYLVNDTHIVTNRAGTTLAQINATGGNFYRNGGAVNLVIQRTDTHGIATVAAFNMNGKNSTPIDYSYAQINVTATDATAGSEDAVMGFECAVAGTRATRMQLGGGLHHPSVSGGDKGANTINFGAVYDDNVLLTDYVFDKFLGIAPAYSSRVEERYEALDPAMFDVAQYAAHWRKTQQLYGMPSLDDCIDGIVKEHSLGAMSQMLWQTAELHAIHIASLHDRVAALEARAH
jgi:hypothetical protein